MLLSLLQIVSHVLRTFTKYESFRRSIASRFADRSVLRVRQFERTSSANAALPLSVHPERQSMQQTIRIIYRIFSEIEST
jgi:hypothetical protein